MIGGSRVLLLSTDRGIPWLGPSGGSAHLRGVASALQDHGFSVTVAVPAVQDARPIVTDAPDVRVLSHAPQPRSRLWGERRERADARALTAHALHTSTFDWIWERHAMAADGGVRSGLPVLLEVNAPIVQERTRNDRVRWPVFANRVERRVLRDAERVITVSTWLRAWALAQGATSVHHVPNATAVRQGSRAVGRRRLGHDHPTAVFVGSRKPWHGLHHLLPLVENNPSWRVVVAGHGPVDAPSHPRIQALPPQNGEALNDLLAACDVGLAPATSDVAPWFCPLKLLDYQAAGLPVLAALHGDVAALLAGHPWRPWSATPGLLDSLALLPREVRVRSWNDVVGEALTAS